MTPLFHGAFLFCVLYLSSIPTPMHAQGHSPLTSPRVKRDLLLQQAQANLSNGSSDAAVGALEEALRLNLSKKQEKQWLPVLAQAYIRQNHYDKAIPVLHQAMEQDPKNWRRHLELGLAYYQVELRDPAIDSLRRAVQLNAEAREALGPLGKLCLRKGLLDEAQADLERLASLEPESSATRLILADVYEQKGEIPKAIQQLTQALSGDKNPQTYFKLGLLYALQGQTQESLEAYRKARTLEPGNPEFELYTGLTYWQTGNAAKAERHFTLAIEKGYPGALPYFFRALISYREGSLPAARADAQRAARLAKGEFLLHLSEKILHAPAQNPAL